MLRATVAPMKIPARRDRTHRSRPSETKAGLSGHCNRAPRGWLRRSLESRKKVREPTLLMWAQKPGSIDRILRYNNRYTSMISGHIGCELVILTVLCVLMIFFFPVMQGPYSAVHGPATALQAARAAARLRIIIVQGALNSLGNILISPLVVLSWMSLSETEIHSASLQAYTTILRC